MSIELQMVVLAAVIVGGVAGFAGVVALAVRRQNKRNRDADHRIATHH